MKLLLFIFCVCTICSSHSQGEDNHWYFGNKAGVDFNTIPPSVLMNSDMHQLEGVDAISDSEGNLLFYTSGWRVWNRWHSVMPNGTNLDGSDTSTQVAIAKKPNSDNLYYIFTVGDYLEETGLKYSIVDMNLNNGLGDVTDKNVSVRSDVSEKVITIPHENGEDIWIIVFEDVSLGDDDHSFYSYLLTADGLQANEVESPIVIEGSMSSTSAGQMKVNARGDRICAVFYRDGIGLFSFDASTGQIEEDYFLEDIPQSSNNAMAIYSIEFSPNSKYVYFIAKEGVADMLVIQLDLNNLPETQSDLNIIGQFTNFLSAGIQLAPDGKIYICDRDGEYLSVIHSPNNFGVSCGFEHDYLYLGGRIIRGGLPPLKNNQFQSPIEIENTCYGDTTEFSLSLTEPFPDSLHWNFDDPISDLNETSGVSETHVYTSPGVYYPILTIYSDDLVYPLTREVIIHDVPYVNLGNDELICEGSSLILSYEENYDSLLWNTGSISDSLVVTNPGHYSLTASYNGCTAQDSIFVQFSFCTNDTLTETTSDTLELFEMYPNPTSDFVNILYKIPDEYSNYGIIIHDELGKLVRREDLSDYEESYTLSTKEFSSGVYFVRFYIENEITKVKKLIVLK